MLSIMHFIFSSFWIWLGTLLIILAVARLRIVEVNNHTHQHINSPSDDHSVINNEE